MTKKEALKLIDDHKNKQVDPVILLNWTWLRVIILNIPEAEWELHVEAAAETLSQ